MYQAGYELGEQDAAKGIYNPPIHKRPANDDSPMANEGGLRAFKGYKDGHAAWKAANNDDSPIDYSTFLESP